jgi:hypothetical protein
VRGAGFNYQLTYDVSPEGTSYQRFLLAAVLEDDGWKRWFARRVIEEAMQVAGYGGIDDISRR